MLTAFGILIFVLGLSLWGVFTNNPVKSYIKKYHKAIIPGIIVAFVTMPLGIFFDEIKEAWLQEAIVSSQYINSGSGNQNITNIEKNIIVQGADPVFLAKKSSELIKNFNNKQSKIAEVEKWHREGEISENSKENLINFINNFERYEKDTKNNPELRESFDNLNNATTENEIDEINQQILQIINQNKKQNDLDELTTYLSSANKYSIIFKYDKAIEMYRLALQLQIKLDGETSSGVAYIYYNFGNVWSYKGDYDKAIDFYDKSLKIKLETLGENHPETARTYNNLGLVWSDKGDNSKSHEYLKKAQEIEKLLNN
ncbi:MAG: tetratricopeptide repeat protein [Candidatus Caenarcaniphilales bacterium]|nr:tetratricopeptide repeat protein [Candidatus Caenarcaniphilales bacterium]